MHKVLHAFEVLSKNAHAITRNVLDLNSDGDLIDPSHTEYNRAHYHQSDAAISIITTALAEVVNCTESWHELSVQLSALAKQAETIIQTWWALHNEALHKAYVREYGPEYEHMIYAQMDLSVPEEENAVIGNRVVKAEHEAPSE